MKQFLRELPAIHILKSDEHFLQYCESFNLNDHEMTDLVQVEIDKLRKDLLNGELEETPPNKETLTRLVFERLLKKLEKYEPFYLRRVINGTGTILHTNLGRAKLSDVAIEQVIQTAKNYSNLEFKIEEGKRGSRHDIIEAVIQRMTGAEAAMVVNNNAAAVYLILRALAKDKEVIVSRGQLVEIGGSFRVSSIMEESGAKLVEVGTTNKTHLYDYENSINEETAMILKVHTSNFKTVGFTASVESDELVELSNKHDGIIFYEDLGSGALYDFRQHGIGDEPVVSKVIEMGVDLVSFSGDKLLGGPQAGIIAGKKELIQKLKKHQLARVLRVDKMTLAALEGTLKAYENGTAMKEIPTVRDILASEQEIEARAQAFINHVEQVCTSYTCKLVDEVSQIGGGTMPTEEIATKAVAIVSNAHSVNDIAEKLRLNKPAIVSRTKADHVILDFRTITTEEILMVVEALKKIEASN
ncbi:L-seryl-tRNA(Sec) selenium transferase [Anaerobacillus isosaccharinicus]|uniref:L-seryl-tRNA(Sec) selenium transferase n=1 Tax=Anaerobacillus isosaccharinicus TaxID=1532552 RepID=A0A7S7RAD9_9BACI|nr:L-seryl-tRNA(Sec) selenium transferase [Anaerobacillus isosaccharinicus]MBA5587008.1 L-seryl-tRNA(Sec) selenium transferase [Anaerobacillus isosaccharinicus]QOY34791.1 L-seryl-tRNA(Sec) selenium transferase [Anaerobacillus isosaccharinicus]